MFCPKCGTENKEDAKFCKKCGINLNDNSEITEKNTGSPVKFLVVICVILVAGLGIAAGYIFHGIGATSNSSGTYQQPGSSLNDSSSNDHSSNSSSSVSSSSSKSSNSSSKKVVCPLCQGTGVCPGCKGEGNIFGTPCIGCNGTGVCSECGGTGYIIKNT